jgi:DMSO/TMAO reductase YedYZ molybdopterin-dependent catalytic subunit
LRLRAENQLGYKMVKWIKEVSFVRSEKEVGKGKEAGTKTTSILIFCRIFSSWDDRAGHYFIRLELKNGVVRVRRQASIERTNSLAFRGANESMT